MAAKHNYMAAKWLGMTVTLAGAIIGFLTINWGALATFGTAVNFLYENHDEIEHLIDDYHDNLNLSTQVFNTQLQLDSLENELFVRTNRDSLIHIIELMNRGKTPYDSIWRKSESGHWYLTTVKNHFLNEHND